MNGRRRLTCCQRKENGDESFAVDEKRTATRALLSTKREGQEERSGEVERSVEVERKREVERRREREMRGRRNGFL